MNGNKQKELLELGTGPKLDYDRSNTFVDLFREQVARTPNAVAVGRPFPNCSVKICDADGQMIPRGQVGELYLSGAHLGMGYINRPKLNEEKYVAGWYRTGDLCRWNDEGELEYIGRIDNQVKLRGYRIELGEIESAMMKFPGVAAAVADVRKVTGSEQLVGYYVATWTRLSQLRRDGVVDSASDADETSASTVADESGLKAFLAKSLPEYMGPSAFVRLEAMPLTPNGKIDRRHLPEPEVSKTFNVLEIEPISDTLLSREDLERFVSPDGYNEFIRLYVLLRALHGNTIGPDLGVAQLVKLIWSALKDG